MNLASDARSLLPCPLNSDMCLGLSDLQGLSNRDTIGLHLSEEKIRGRAEKDRERASDQRGLGFQI